MDRGWAGRSAGSGLGTRTGRGSRPGPTEQQAGRIVRPAHLSQGSWLLPSRWRCWVAAEGGLGLGGLTAPEAVAGIEALLLRGGGGGLPPLLGPASLLPALPPAACWPIHRGRPWPRGAVGCWPRERRSQYSHTRRGGGDRSHPRPGPWSQQGVPGKSWGRGPAWSPDPGQAAGAWGTTRKRVPMGSWPPNSSHRPLRVPLHTPPSVSADRPGPFSRDLCFLSLRRWQRWWWWGAAWLAGARSRVALQR